MAIKLTNKVDDINYHFANNIISDSTFSRNLRTIKLDRTLIVTQRYEKRPDLLARILFGSDDYDWILLFINGLTVDELVNGVVIKYCDKSELNKILIE